MSRRTYRLPLTIDGGQLWGHTIVAPSVSVINGGVLSTMYSTTSRVHRLELDIPGQILVDATSRIDVSGKGYRAGRTTGNTTVGGATGLSGGSYGGSGGLRGGGTNAVYGDYLDPDDWGSGGGGGGSGGGLVRIAAETLTLDGQILADGRNSVGGGSGGGVLLAVTTLQGSGLIRASGGDGGLSNGWTGGGGGGRIAAYAEDFSGFDVGAITASGGQGVSGGAGTVYIIQGLLHTHVRSHTPVGLNGGHVPGLDHITLEFNKEIDLGSFDAADFRIDGPLGSIPPTNLAPVDDRTYRLDFAPQNENGSYHFTLLPTLLDIEGFELDQDADSIPGEPVEDSYSFKLIVDTVPPRVTQHTPAGDITGTVDHTDIWFSEKIDTTTFTSSDVSITRPDSQSISVTGIQEIGFNRFRIGFAPQTTVGVYHVVIGPDVRDLAGNLLDQDQDGNFGEPSEDAYDATFNYVSVDLQVSNVVVDPAQLWAGEAATVSWDGSYASGAPLLGDWTDGVYLSADDQWDIQDIRLATVERTGGLLQNEIYSASVDSYVPGALPGDYFILVRTDVFNEAKEAVGESNNITVVGPFLLNVQQLPADGIAVSGELTYEDRSDFYSIDVAPGEYVMLTLDGQASTGSNELYIGYGSIPSRSDFDYRANAGGQDQFLVYPGTPAGGTLYASVYAASVESTTPYQLTAHTGSVLVSTITPGRHGNATSATVTVTGGGFDQDTTFEFIATDGTTYIPVRSDVISTSTSRLELDLPAWPVGSYDIRVTKGNMSPTLADAFQVVEGNVYTLETTLTVPAAVGFLIPIRQTIWVEYTNTGDIAMPAPLLRLHGSHGSRLTLDPELKPHSGFGEIPGTSDTVQLLGLGTTSTPWLLQPDESARIPIYYLGLSQASSYPRVEFNLDYVTADDPRPIEWAEQEALIRPADLDDTTWSVQFAEIQEWFGPTWGDYVRKLAEAAEDWSRFSSDPLYEALDLYTYSLLIMEQSDQVIPQTIGPKISGYNTQAATGNPAEDIPGWINDPYGWRWHPIKKRPVPHKGIDMRYGVGTTLGAVESGTASFKGFDTANGFWIELVGKVDTWRYLHLDWATADIYKGAPKEVEYGALVAYSGDTGAVTGAHLHLQRVGGAPLQVLEYSGTPAFVAGERSGNGAGQGWVKMRVNVTAPTCDLKHVLVELFAINGLRVIPPQAIAALSVDSPPEGSIGPYPLLYKDGVWHLDVNANGLPFIELGCERESYTFRVTSMTYDTDLTPTESYVVYVIPKTQQEMEKCECPSGNCGGPSPPSGPGTGGSSQLVGSFDPNDKLAPAGWGSGGYIRADGSIPYRIRFENKSDATAPARQITISDALDDTLDLYTLELTEIGFANQIINVPHDLSQFATVVPFDAQGTEVLVEVTAGLNFESRELTLTLRAIDSATGWYPEDPLIGLLYPNDDSGRGEGYLSYIVRPKSGLPSGTIIENRASIVFDYNDPIETPLVLNTLDSGVPQSNISPLPAVTTTAEFQLQWSGQDEPGGSGIAAYDVYVSVDGGPDFLLLEGITDTSVTLTAEHGHTYAFYSVAIDNVGHREAAPSAPDAVTTLDLPPAVVDRHIFYNNSKWDAHAGFEDGDPAANEFDDAAIATDKQALLPGETATFANYTSYHRGINGIMVDILALADPAAVADDDFSEFVFRYGNDDTPDDWLPAADPVDVEVRDIGGGVHRVTIIWADNAIPNKQWLQVTVKQHPATGLAADDVFYFGNSSGENTGDFRVDYSDAFDNIWPSLFTPAEIGVENPADVNRDKRIDYSDVFDAVWPNLFGPSPLVQLTAPTTPASLLESTDSVFGKNRPWAIELMWFNELYGGSDDSEEDDPLEATAVDGVFMMYSEE